MTALLDVFLIVFKRCRRIRKNTIEYPIQIHSVHTAIQKVYQWFHLTWISNGSYCMGWLEMLLQWGRKSKNSKNSNFMSAGCGKNGRHSKKSKDHTAEKSPPRKACPGIRNLGYLLRNFRGWILHELSAREILENYESSMLENSTFVCLYFSRGQQKYFGTEYIFLATINGPPFIF